MDVFIDPGSKDLTVAGNRVPRLIETVIALGITMSVGRVRPTRHMTHCAQGPGWQDAGIHWRLQVVDDFFNGQVAAKNAIEARDAFVKAGGKLHSDGGNMVILKFIPGYSAGDDREAGFKDGTKDKPFNIVATEFAGFDNASGYKAMSQLIPSLRDGGIDFVYGMSDGPVTGAVKALEEAGMTPGKDVYLVSATCIADISAISTAKEFATGVQAAGLEGWFSINVVARYFEYGSKVTDGSYIAPDTADARPEFSFAPSKVNIIPNPQVVVGADPAKAGEVLQKFKLWGQTFNDHCVY